MMAGDEHICIYLFSHCHPLVQCHGLVALGQMDSCPQCFQTALQGTGVRIIQGVFPRARVIGNRSSARIGSAMSGIKQDGDACKRCASIALEAGLLLEVNYCIFTVKLYIPTGQFAARIELEGQGYCTAVLRNGGFDGGTKGTVEHRSVHLFETGKVVKGNADAPVCHFTSESRAFGAGNHELFTLFDLPQQD